MTTVMKVGDLVDLLQAMPRDACVLLADEDVLLADEGGEEYIYKIVGVSDLFEVQETKACFLIYNR